MQPGDFITIAGRLASMHLGAVGHVRRQPRGITRRFHLAMSVLEQFATAPPRNGQGHVLAPAFSKCENHVDSTIAASLLQDLQHGRIFKAYYQIRDARIETPEFARSEIEVAMEVQKRLISFWTPVDPIQRW